MSGCYRRTCRLLILATCTQLPISLPASAQELVVGRYSTLKAAPSPGQVNLLAAIVYSHLPDSVDTVGGAILHVLRDTGYRLSTATVANPARAALLELPLPEPHRQLGPLSVQTALETLAGPAFRLVEDPVHRLISFERCGSLPVEVAVRSTRASR